MGYSRAGFEVVGIDIKPQPRHPFEFAQADAISVMSRLIEGHSIGAVYPVLSGLPYTLADFDAIHASPPCQFATRARLVGTRKTDNWQPLNLIPQTREFCEASGLPYIIENVDHARPHLIDPIMLCGSMFNLQIDKDGETFQLRRHRLFESSVELVPPGKCAHKGRVLGLYGSMGDHVQGVDSQTGRYVMGGRTVDNIEDGRALMGIDWMIWKELKEALPPVYTEYLGSQLMGALDVPIELKVL